jgi:hypothetical protein
MKLGVTGTRSGMSEDQKLKVIEFLDSQAFSELHHGDCVGVDVEVAELAKHKGIRIVCHPPLKDELRGWFDSDQTNPPLSYFARNRNIVDQTDQLLVVPFQTSPQDNGGTWYTFDYAKKKGKPTTVIFPDQERIS